MKKQLILFLIAVILFLSCFNKPDFQNSEKERAKLYQHQEQALIISERVSDPEIFEIHTMDIDINTQESSLEVHHSINFRNQFPETLYTLCFRTLMNSLGGNIEFYSIAVNGKKFEGKTETDDPSVLYIPLEKPLVSGDSVTITFHYKTTIPQAKPKNSRLFASYKNNMILDYFYPLIQLPVQGKYIINDVLSYGDLIFTQAGIYSAVITYPGNMDIASTGTVISKKKTEQDKKKIEVVTGPARGFFLALSSEWIKLSDTIGETVINIYGPSKYKRDLNYCLTITSSGIKLFSEMLSDYPYKEFDILFLPAEWSAMEFPGIIVLGINYLKYIDNYADTPGFRNIKTILMHELVHQWFFNYVGNNQILEPWIDEGFTQYMLYYYYLKTEGKAKAEIYLDFLHKLDKYTNTKTPVNLSIADYGGGRNYTGAVYGSSALMLHSIALETSKEDFLRFCKWYMKKYRWGVNNTKTFLSDIKQFFDNSTKEMIMKYFDKNALK